MGLDFTGKQIKKNALKKTAKMKAKPKPKPNQISDPEHFTIQFINTYRRIKLWQNTTRKLWRKNHR